MTDVAPLIELDQLVVQYRSGGGVLPGSAQRFNAVDGVSLDILPGEVFGLVGESGCGKTTLGRAILRIVDTASGTIRFDGTDITSMNERQLRALRRDMQTIFQDPYSSLNPRMTVERIVAEPILTHEKRDRHMIRDRVATALEAVGIDPARMADYPHQFSGGQRQRIGIARALTMRPRFIVCDEATSALDVSVRAQIINLLDDLRKQYGLTYLMISHDLGSLRQLCDRIGVMYLGRLVEIGEAGQIFDAPRHPYTQSLLSAMPVPDPRKERSRRRIVLQGDVPSPLAVPSGCCFHTRCWRSEELGHPDRCHTDPPDLAARGGAGCVACHFADDDTPPTRTAE